MGTKDLSFFPGSRAIMQVAKTCINKTKKAQSNMVLLKNSFFTNLRHIQIKGTIEYTHIYLLEGKRKKGAVSPIARS